MTASVIAAIIALAACSGGSVAAPPATPALANEMSTDVATDAGAGALEPGVYVYDHTIAVVCDQWGNCPERVTDRLTVLDASDDAMSVRIELVATNYHTCSFEGTLDRDGADRWQWRAPPSEPACIVTLTVASDIAVDSEGCSDYCGARAALVARFPRSRP